MDGVADSEFKVSSCDANAEAINNLGGFLLHHSTENCQLQR